MDLDELVFHPWTVQGPRDVLTFVGGSGRNVIDADGRCYLDFSSRTGEDVDELACRDTACLGTNEVRR